MAMNFKDASTRQIMADMDKMIEYVCDSQTRKTEETMAKAKKPKGETEIAPGIFTMDKKENGAWCRYCDTREFNLLTDPVIVDPWRCMRCDGQLYTKQDKHSPLPPVQR